MGFKLHHQESKNQCAEWDKIFAHNLFDKGLINAVPKELWELNNKNTHTQKKTTQFVRVDFSPKKIHKYQQAHEKMLDNSHLECISKSQLNDTSNIMKKTDNKC